MAEDKKRTRQPNGRSSIYQGKDGKWHGRVKEAGESTGLTAAECRSTLRSALNWSIAHNQQQRRTA
ncbi:hypothetical protein GCM10010095_84110 [Streptomyces anthocyanicus]|uniref:hypothetical protein n=1 Tax=Streptomyces anthocyanicus TaxID=68174 RepID=UPI00198345CA|nr:hypothetical protein GCM10010095_84110 [Streptomyces anthocyanicus]